MKKFQTVGIILIVLIMAVATFYVNKGINRFINSSYFNVRNVKLIGVLNADAKTLDKVCKKMIGKNIFQIKNEAYSKYFNDVWVDKIEIKKTYPSTIKVIVYEKTPLFYFNKRGRIYSYLSDGSYIKAKVKSSNIYVFGKYWEENLKKFVYFSNHDYLKGIDKIEIRDSYMKIKNDDFIIMSNYDIGSFNKSIKRLDGIIKRYKKINYVDLRIDNRIYVDGVRL